MISLLINKMGTTTLPPWYHYKEWEIIFFSNNSSRIQSWILILSLLVSWVIGFNSSNHSGWLGVQIFPNFSRLVSTFACLPRCVPSSLDNHILFCLRETTSLIVQSDGTVNQSALVSASSAQPIRCSPLKLPCWAEWYKGWCWLDLTGEMV